MNIFSLGYIFNKMYITQYCDLSSLNDEVSDSVYGPFYN